MSVRYGSLCGLNANRGTRSSLRAPFFNLRLTPVLTPATGMSNGGYATVVLPSTAHTLSGWSAIVASPTTADVHFVRLICPNLAAASTNSATLIDIGIGAAGSEVVVASGIAFGGAVGNGGCPIPLFIPAGSRVCLRMQSARTSLTTYPLVLLYATQFASTTPRTVDVLGISRANSGGTPMAGSSGTYTQIVASTTRDYQSLICFPSLSAGTTSNSNQNGALTTAVGAAGAERDIFEATFAVFNGSNSIYETSGFNYIGGGGHVPAGTRIAVKHNMTSSPGAVAATIIGVPYA